MCGNFIIPSAGWGESTTASAPNWASVCQDATVQEVNADTEQEGQVQSEMFRLHCAATYRLLKIRKT